MSLLVLGTVALDNVKTHKGFRKNMLGGSAAHFCMSARLFTKVNLVAVVGEDFPKAYVHFLKDRGINLLSLTYAKGKTFRWNGEYKREDLNTALTLATEIGVLAGFTPQVHRRHRNTANIFLANIDPDIQMGLLKMIHSPKLVGLDSMNLWIKHKKPSLIKLMRRVDLFVANDGEARMLSEEHNLIKAAKRLRALGPRWIVIKKGEHGVFFYSDDFKFSMPAYPVEDICDPTGAGDTFAGGLMGHLSRVTKITPATFKEALAYATAIASFNVEGFGMDKTSNLTMAQVQKRKRELIKFISFR